MKTAKGVKSGAAGESTWIGMDKEIDTFPQRSGYLSARGQLLFYFVYTCEARARVVPGAFHGAAGSRLAIACAVLAQAVVHSADSCRAGGTSERSIVMKPKRGKKSWA